MNDPADRHLGEQELEGRLHALAHGFDVPVVPAAADVRRGRRRLIRVRLAMAGATTGALAVVLGVTGLTAGDPHATEVGPASQLPSSTTTPPSPDSGAAKASGGPDAGSDPPASSGDLTFSGAGPGSVHDSAVDRSTVGGPTGDSSTGAVAQGTRGGTSAGHWPHGTATDPTDLPTQSSSPTDLPTDQSTGQPTEQPTGPTTPPTTPTEEPTPPVTPPPTTGKVRINKVLDYYNDVVAEHLDSMRDHLREFDPSLDARTIARRSGRLFALGSSYRWATAKDTDDVRVRVASGWDQVPWGCGAPGSDWVCHPTADGEVGVHDGVVEAAVEHDDGQVVVVAGTLPEADLVTAAGDERLILPGDTPPVSPPTLDPETFASSGEAALIPAGESFARTSLSRAPAVRGTWAVDGIDRGTLSWSAAPIYSGGGWSCLKGYRTCVDLQVEVDGETVTVHLARLRPRLGGGWLVQYDGPSYAVRVASTDRTFPKKRAFGFVTDDAWQPVR